MNEFKIYYQIVPIDDGYTFLCQNKNTNELYLRQKSEGKSSESLIFSSRQAAEKWIEQSTILNKRFKVEEFCASNIIENLVGGMQCSYMKLEQDPECNIYLLG